MASINVWWIPQVPGKPFYVHDLPSIDEAARLCNTLAEYDLFQYNNHIKPDYSNAGGIEVDFGNDDIELYDWEDPEEIAYVKELLAREESK